MGDVLGYVAAGLLAIWGAGHLVPTRDVVAGFGEISEDNRRILTMEWVAEGLAMILIALVAALSIVSGGTDDAVVRVVLRTSAGGLVVFGIWTAATGARTPVVWFKACPIVLAATAALMVTATLI